eukprot:614131-Rhodomonas_salina.1
MAAQIEGLFEHIMMDWLRNVQQLMLTLESVANSGDSERVTQATCGGVCVGADVGGDSVVKQAAQQLSRGGAARQESDFSGCKTGGIIQEHTVFLGPCPPDGPRQPNKSHNQRLSWHNQ